MRENAIIKAKRLELGLTDLEVAKQSGISIYEYGDIEQHADEFVTVPNLIVARKICDVLGIDFLELIQDEIGNFTQPIDITTSTLHFPRHELISKRRESLGITQSQLAESLGFEKDEINKIENEPLHIDNWSIELVISLAKALELSPQVLLGR